MPNQLSMFDGNDETATNRQGNEHCALDEMFSASRRYRGSREYMELLNFVSKFRRYAPFNGLLLHLQNPDVTYVASASDWGNRFNRRPKRDARPLVILQPFGPVMFVYDYLDTDGAPVPDSVCKPFNTMGELSTVVYARTIHNCSVHRIEIRIDLKGLFGAGKAFRLSPKTREQFKDLSLSPGSVYLILLNRNHSLEEKYSTLAHELGHIFCGHLGTDSIAWWEARIGISEGREEIEAESVAYLVCMRQGLKLNSESYLSQYQTPHGHDTELPFFGLNAVFQATDYIEKMGESKWKKPLKKPKAKAAG